MRGVPASSKPFQLILSVDGRMLSEANGKMRTCGDAGLQFRVSRVRV